MNSTKNKHLLTISIFLFAIIILTSLGGGCGKKSEVKDNADDQKKKDTIKAVMYTCPMHPEVKSTNKNDKCPKCGMNLEEMKEAGSESNTKMHSDKYSLKLTTKPQNPKSGEDVTLNFSLINNETNQVIKDLAVVHEKILHLIIVSRNLAYFDHIHPEMNADGSLSVITKFSKGGDYVLFADLTPNGETKNQVFDIPLTVEGEPVEKIALSPNNIFESAGYVATLTTEPSDLVVDKSIEIKVNLKKDGKDVTNLQNYLGALGHMVVISEDASMYLHVHPMEPEGKGHTHEHGKETSHMKSGSEKETKNGPDVIFHTKFTKAGIYKVFAQFNPGGKLITTNFVVKVK